MKANAKIKSAAQASNKTMIEIDKKLEDKIKKMIELQNKLQKECEEKIAGMDTYNELTSIESQIAMEICSTYKYKLDISNRA